MRNSQITFAVGFLLLGVMLANVVGQDIPPEREPNLFGKVIDSRTEEPVHALITLHGGREESWKITVETDREGVFKVHVRPGEVFIRISAEGYSPKEDVLEIPEGEPMEIHVMMERIENPPEHNVFGMMTGVDGVPLQGVIVFYAGDRVAAKMETGRDGSFELFLDPGTYSWHAESRGYAPARGELEVPREGPARLMVVLERTGSDVPSGALIGIIRDVKGGPVGGAKVAAFPLDMEPVYDIPQERTAIGPEPITVISERDGTFGMKLPLGAYLVRIHAEGFEPFEARIHLTRERPEMRMEVELSFIEKDMEKYVKIHVEYTDSNSDGNPEKIIIVADTGGDEFPDLTLEMTDSDSDGNFESVIFDMNAPLKELMLLMSMIMERLNMMEPGGYPVMEDPWREGEYPPLTDEDEGGMEHPPAPDAAYDPGMKMDPDGENLVDQAAVSVDEGGEGTSAGDVKEESSSSKDSKGGSESPLPEILAASAVLLLLISGVFITGYFLKRKY